LQTKCSRSVLIQNRACISSKSAEYQYLERSSEPTDKHQNDLPLLPIPSLNDSCDRYLSALRPLIQSQNQFQDTERRVAEFERAVGKQLDHELRQRAKQQTDRTYFSDDWQESYLTHRPPIPIHMNPYLILRNDPSPAAQQPPVRAANLILSALRYRRSLIEKKLSPEKFDLRFLDHLFGSSRLPQPDRDLMQHSDDSRHIVLLRRGRFFEFDVLDDQGDLRPASEIARFVHGVYSLPAEPDADPSICWFTGDSRDLWANSRQHLQSLTSTNRDNLHKIDSALLLVCLDSQTYDQADRSSQALGFLHGLYELPLDQLAAQALSSNQVQLNRWFDKSMQIIVTANGVAGGCFEHSWADGIIWQQALHKIYEDSIQNRFVADLNDHVDDVRSTEITFTLDDRSKHELNEARKRFLKFASSVQMRVIEYENMDRGYLKSKRISPDFVFQLAFQMAYYRLFTGTGSCLFC
jgi:carnitine O-palmitoyltransferase 2